MAEAGQTPRSTAAGPGMGASTVGSQGGTGTGGTGTGSMGSGGTHAGTSGAAGSKSGGASDTPDLGDLKTIASGVASDIANTAAEQSRGLLQAAKGTATSFADERKGTAAKSIADLASSLRDTGNAFDEQPSLKAFVGTAADGLEQIASGLRDRSFGEIYGDVEAMARRQPITFGAGAAIAGFLLARFIKSSAEEMSEANAARTRSARAAGSARTAGTAQPGSTARAGGTGTAGAPGTGAVGRG